MLREATCLGSVEKSLQQRDTAQPGGHQAGGGQGGGATTVSAVLMLSQLYIPSTYSLQSTSVPQCGHWQSQWASPLPQ